MAEEKTSRRAHRQPDVALEEEEEEEPLDDIDEGEDGGLEELMGLEEGGEGPDDENDFSAEDLEDDETEAWDENAGGRRGAVNRIIQQVRGEASPRIRAKLHFKIRAMLHFKIRTPQLNYCTLKGTSISWSKLFLIVGVCIGVLGGLGQLYPTALSTGVGAHPQVRSPRRSGRLHVLHSPWLNERNLMNSRTSRLPTSQVTDQGSWTRDFRYVQSHGTAMSHGIIEGPRGRDPVPLHSHQEIYLGRAVPGRERPSDLFRGTSSKIR